MITFHHSSWQISGVLFDQTSVLVEDISSESVDLLWYFQPE